MTIKVYFDLAADGKEIGRITMELYDDVVPRTVGSCLSLLISLSSSSLFLLLLFFFLSAIFQVLHNGKRETFHEIPLAHCW